MYCSLSYLAGLVVAHLLILKGINQPNSRVLFRRIREGTNLPVQLLSISPL